MDIIELLLFVVGFIFVWYELLGLFENINAALKAYTENKQAKTRLLIKGKL